jgi:polyisoprenoid-binding protein YceI
MSSPTRRSRFLALSALLLGLYACETSPPPQAPAAPVPAATEPGKAAPGSRELHVVPEQSLLEIFVHRGGKMARMGHNHVIAAHALAGSVYLAKELPATRFDITFNVADLTIDEPELRARAGADFPPGVPQSARDGTRKNMLSPGLLGGEEFPDIRLRTTDVVQNDDGYDVGVEVTIKGQAHVLRVPMHVEQGDGSVHATGEFPLTQSQLGLTPFTVMMGALTVLDDMKVSFDVIAR